MEIMNRFLVTLRFVDIIFYENKAHFICIIVIVCVGIILLLFFYLISIVNSDS